MTRFPVPKQREPKPYDLARPERPVLNSAGASTRPIAARRPLHWQSESSRPSIRRRGTGQPISLIRDNCRSSTLPRRITEPTEHADELRWPALCQPPRMSRKPRPPTCPCLPGAAAHESAEGAAPVHIGLLRPSTVVQQADPLTQLIEQNCGLERCQYRHNSRSQIPPGKTQALRRQDFIGAPLGKATCTLQNAKQHAAFGGKLSTV